MEPVAVDQSSPWPYQSIGDGHHPPVVFLHGFMGSGADWFRVAQRCAGEFYCVMADLPGHGHNVDLSISQPLNFDVMVKGLNNFLEQAGLDKAGLVGYSMGGRIALYAALRLPHKIRSLVLVSSNPGIAGEQARQTRAEVDDSRAKTVLAEGLNAFVEQWYEMGLFDTLKGHPPLLEQMKTQRKRNEAQWVAKTIRELSPGRQPSLWEELGTLSMPVMLVAGALDSKYREIMAAMSARIPEASLEIIPEAGHNVQLENPEYFAGLVTGFLKRTMG